MSIVHLNDGEVLNYECFGAGAHALVCLHGWGGTLGFWRDMTSVLDLTTYRLLLVDFRGHGGSTGRAIDYTLERFAADVLEVANHAGAQTFSIVGHSIGAKIAQCVSLLFPERVVGQVLVAGYALDPKHLPDDQRAGMLACAGNFGAMRQLCTSLMHVRPDEGRIDEVSHAAASIPRWVLECTLGLSEAALAALPAPAPLTPTLVIAGEYDPIFSPEYLQQNVVARWPNGKMLTLKAGHEIPIEVSAKVADAIVTFLAEVGASNVNYFFAETPTTRSTNTSDLAAAALDSERSPR